MPNERRVRLLLQRATRQKPGRNTNCFFPRRSKCLGRSLPDGFSGSRRCDWPCVTSAIHPDGLAGVLEPVLRICWRGARTIDARNAMTGFLIVDAQNVKNTDNSGQKRYAGKKGSGIKRHIAAVGVEGNRHASTRISTRGEPSLLLTIFFFHPHDPTHGHTLSRSPDLRSCRACTLPGSGQRGGDSG